MRDQLGMPLEYHALKHGYFYTQEVHEFPMLQLSRNDLVALFLARHALEPLRGTRLERMLSDSFSKIAELGKRVGMSIGEITSTMNQMHGGRLASVLENAVDRNMSTLRQDVSFAGKDDSFLRAEAARRASAEIARPMETMLEIGRLGGLDSRMVTGMAMAHSEMLGSAGMGAASGIMATNMVAQSNITPVQASAMAMGASQRAMASKSGQLMGTLQQMIASGILEEGSAEVSSLRQGILSGSVDASTLSGKGATPAMLSAGAQQRGVLR
jgi:hypothetical protein